MSIFSHPIKKLTVLGIFAGGYVLGAKAGRERYEQIRRTANQVKDDPRVQEAASRAEDLAREAATKVTEDPHVKEAATRAQDLLRDATATVSGAVGGDNNTDTKTDSNNTKSDSKTGTETNGDVHPLLADKHVEVEEEVVYSSGPDIEETVDELRPTNDSERL